MFNRQKFYDANVFYVILVFHAQHFVHIASCEVFSFETSFLHIGIQPTQMMPNIDVAEIESKGIYFCHLHLVDECVESSIDRAIQGKAIIARTLASFEPS